MEGGHAFHGRRISYFYGGQLPVFGSSAISTVSISKPKYGVAPLDHNVHGIYTRSVLIFASFQKMTHGLPVVSVTMMCV